MYFADAPMNAGEVLQAFRHDEPLLFLSAAFITVAVIAASLCVLRRRFDPLMVFLALFAYLYGERLRLDAHVMGLSHVHDEWFFRLRNAIKYLVPIPAFAFFEAAGFLGRRGKTMVVLLSIVFLSLVAGAFLLGPLQIFRQINSGVIVVTVPAMVLRSYFLGRGDRDFRALQIGLICFVVPAIWDNIVGTYWHESQLEPYGFAIFLGSLGYVAARRLLRREHDFGLIEQELEMARRIQISILPGEFPESPAFRVAARYVPMRSVAGDFYDFLVADPTQTGLLIADVSGHGVPAALIASMVKMAGTSQRDNAARPAMVLRGMNDALFGNTQDQFVTAAYLYLNAEMSEYRYAAAGHPAMILLRDGQVTEVIENGLLLAVVPHLTFTEATHTARSGDRLVLYTDGLLEARSEGGEMFGESRLHTAVLDSAGRPPAEAADQIIARVQCWAPVQDDDLTVLICDYAG